MKADYHARHFVVPDDHVAPLQNYLLEQAAKFAESLAKGQPHRNKIALTVLSDTVREQV